MVPNGSEGEYDGFRAAAMLAGSIGVEIYRDPSVVLRGLAVVEERVRALDAKLSGRSLPLPELEQLAAGGRFGIAEPLRRIRETATAIREGRMYNPAGLGASFAMIDYTCRTLEATMSRDGCP